MKSIHEKCHLKQLIQILNRLGLCISYDELERIDFSLANEIVSGCMENKVPLSPTITSVSIIHGLMDSFDHNENTLPSKGSSHDTIVMVFQNSNILVDTENVLQKSVSCNFMSESFTFSKVSEGEITNNSKVGKVKVPENIKESVTADFKLWVLACYKAPLLKNETKTPSFIATKILILTLHVDMTKCVFTPIIPHPATEYSTIYTCMKNYPDIFNQRHIYSLWSLKV